MNLSDVRHLQQDASHESRPHRHAAGQLFTVSQGVVTVVSENGRWVMPPACLGWVPPFVMHGATQHGDMRGMSLYLDEAWSRQHMPSGLKVVRYTPLIAALIQELVSLRDAPAERQDAYLWVLADAIRGAPEQALFLPMPGEKRLIALTTQLLQQPDDAADLDTWAQRLGMSRRTLTRRFLQETGLSVGQWRQQMRLMLALEKLGSGMAVTTVALDLGYRSVSAFIAMFREYFGSSPKAWLER